MLAKPLEIRHSLIARQHAAHHWLILGGQFRHALFDGNQIFRRKRALVGEVVIEAVFDDRADGDLSFREQLLDRIGQQVGRRVTNHLDTFGIALGDDRQIDILVDQIGGIDQNAIDLASQRGAGQTGTDAGGDFGNGHCLLVGANGTIRQFDIRHGGFSGKNLDEKKVRPEPHFFIDE
ncbi:hypothetical protein SDC9_172333 [bioreactor metagenome]|uniref:Uncharacterized protein n=1 Tax=bioreactor metagenome TaxID=1076179 RepID=A0A645GDF2_9ZZZZ